MAQHWCKTLKNKLIPRLYYRRLTEGEKKLIQSVFGEAINLESIKIISAPWIMKNYAFSPNGNIYFNPQNWRMDFSQASLSEKSWFIHELVHVWQFQQGMAVVRRALFNRRYKYKLLPKKSFFKFGIEQQAQIVQDYFLAKSVGKDVSELHTILPFTKYSDTKPNNMTLNTDPLASLPELANILEPSRLKDTPTTENPSNVLESDLLESDLLASNVLEKDNKNDQIG